MEEKKIKFINKVQENYNETHAEKIIKAYYFAKTAHAGQKRQSGEDYFIHPNAVAEILIDLGLDCDTVVAALLHDVIEDTDYTADDISQMFGQVVLSLVQGVTKLGKLNFKSKLEEQAENLRRMFMAMSNDIRVIIIKLADRLHNMRTLSFKDEEGQKRIAQETLDIYAPIAARLGISSVKGELEDLCLRYLYPDSYYFIAEKVAQTKIERQELVNHISGELHEMLDELGIKGEVNGRPKHFYSIYRKLNKGKPFEQIYDLIALRVIVDNVKDCYAVLGAIHTKWKPLPGRFKDYISVPKANLYQSLHTTVLTSYGAPFEIQIRTFEMHKIAEYGIAAHWKYKQGTNIDTTKIEDDKLAWIRNVMQLQDEASDSQEYLDMLKVDLYSDQVFVFTPKGDVFNLPNGSTGVDFAFAIHSKVGEKCTGIKVNSRIMPVSTKLNNGDVVEVITSNTSKGPSRDWLKFVITPSAKSKIRSFFKKEMREENEKRGREILEKEAKHRGYALNDLLSTESWNKFIRQKYGLNTQEEVLALVGYGELTSLQVINKMVELYKSEHVNESTALEQMTKKTTARKQNGGVVIKGQHGLKYRFSQCCSPLPGDEILGYITRNGGVAIHRADCPNCKGFEPERIIETQWSISEDEKFVANLVISAFDRTGLVVEIATLITNMKVAMTSISAKSEKNNLASIKVSVEVKNANMLKILMDKITQSIKGIREIKRASKSVKNQ
ncbi:MAG: bifunctional (p)ppGpp synthetase/guanosine-3',5'-bis(diphosphate) 3'-pyrophosphohydrolase [Clostridia bacterium]|nr:bifunctional (p)ppGpp synthetase/guanosine-3',5'-bis(diphosphate) 3'-pyrophosphohydrolase [Clostridia bacterium]